ncbi:MAG: type II toxin-antitoxin system VapC family toxin, partial [Anaerolineae bacterium]
MDRFQKCEEAGDTVGVASISITEIVYLAEKGRVPAAALPRLQEHLARKSAIIEVIPLTYDSALAVQKVLRTQVPDLPDRIIAATALHLGVPLISRDHRIRVAG